MAADIHRVFSAFSASFPHLAITLICKLINFARSGTDLWIRCGIPSISERKYAVPVLINTLDSAHSHTGTHGLWIIHFSTPHHLTHIFLEKEKEIIILM